MLVEERRQKLADLVSQLGYAPLHELVARLGVSESTVRRDLDSLDDAGVVRRTHGGARACVDSAPLSPFEERSDRQAREKRLIAERAAALIQDGETILLDGGTTTLEVARRLVHRSLQVVTNSLPIANLFAASRTAELIIVGGFVYPKTGVALGSVAVLALQKIHADRLVMSVSGLTAKGLFNGNLLLVETERAMMAAADETIVVADHSKFGRTALAYLDDWSHVDRLVVDDRASSEQLAMAGPDVEVLVAGAEAPVDV